MAEDESSQDKKNRRKKSWVSIYCSRPGNSFFCQVSKQFMQDNFNLYDLKTHFESEKAYKDALSMLLDEASIRKNITSSRLLNAEFLYGLIHARYILSLQGLDAMRRKYLEGDFGECPRHGCEEQPVLPIGLAQEVGVQCVKVFCAKCRHVYSCPDISLDSAFFGPTFPHLFYMTFTSLVPECTTDEASFVPRVFGFKIHSSSPSLPSNRKESSKSDNSFNITSIQQHNSVHQVVPDQSGENGAKEASKRSLQELLISDNSLSSEEQGKAEQPNKRVKIEQNVC